LDNKIEITLELLELIKNQEEVISKQNEIIARLTSENLEKENFINTNYV